ncbi:MAG TPA: glycosyl transferase, partial [Segetibacter sp.]
MMAGKWLLRNRSFETPAMFRSSSYSFEFYAPGYVQRLETLADLDKFLEESDERVIYTTNSNLEELKLQGYHLFVLATFPDFHISMLTPRFLNPSTRDSQLEKIVLVALQKKNR